MPGNRDDRTYARGDGNALALAAAWSDGWKACLNDGSAAVNPFDGTSPLDREG